jgi:hypothetical protein
MPLSYASTPPPSKKKKWAFAGEKYTSQTGACVDLFFFAFTTACWTQRRTLAPFWHQQLSIGATDFFFSALCLRGKGDFLIAVRLSLSSASQRMDVGDEDGAHHINPSAARRRESDAASQSWVERLPEEILEPILLAIADPPEGGDGWGSTPLVPLLFVCRRWYAIVRSHCRDAGRAMSWAAGEGIFSLTVWLKTQGCRWNESTCGDAARGGHMAVLRRLRAESCPWNRWASAKAARGGHLSVLKWLRDGGCPWDELTCSLAAKEGHPEVLRWLRANGHPWNRLTCESAATGGHLEVLQWLHANGCPWDGRTCQAAASEGQLSMLRWLHANGCRWDELTCAHAARRGHMAVLRWLRANGCPWDMQTLKYLFDFRRINIHFLFCRTNSVRDLIFV